MSDNMRIWSQIPKTDPRYTKAANVDGNRQTSIDGVYMVKLATEVLGPVGEGWGYEIKEERYDDTRPQLMTIGDRQELIWEQVHTIKLEMWHGVRENTFTQFGHTKSRYMKSDGSKWVVDNEAPKKSLTDAIKKCLSLLGVCSDVFMGEFDDQNYQQAAAMESDLKNADSRDKAELEKIDEIRVGVADGVKSMGTCPNWPAVEKVYTLTINKLMRLCPVVGLSFDEERKPMDEMYFQMQEKFNQEKNQ